MATKKTTKKVTSGGYDTKGNDIIMSMPQIFHFNMNDYMTSINNAKSITFSHRAMLFDMYDSATLDLHLAGVLDKRLRAVTRFPIEFWKDGQPDEVLTPQLKSPWFKQLRKDILLSEFWGFTLCQFYLDEDGLIKYDMIPRKHYDPVHKKLLKYQNDTDGRNIDEFENMLFVGTERGLGIFAELLPAVLYKRGDMSDWAQFCNIFGMPIREYTYDAGDEETRKRLIADARKQGVNAVYIHPKDSNLNFVEAGNKTGSAELYERFADYWDDKISIRVLGNTLTSDTSSNGTQALGTIHKEEEDSMNADDRNFILDVLNYHMKDIFTALGFNVDGGEFVYAKKEEVNLTQQLSIVQGLNAMGLPMSDDYLYETFGIDKPENYDQIKEEKELQKQALRDALNKASEEETEPEEKTEQTQNQEEKKGLRDKLRSFFGLTTRPTEEDEW